ncbi:MAG: BlaI/MecI/CopY family transcriptional regulator [Candidatus Eremiobacterota bacterium]
MNKNNYLHLGDLELQIMNIIWDKDRPCSVSEIHETLYPENKRAYTTIMTIMGNLYKKGVLERKKEGNAYLYFPVKKREELAVGFINKITKGFFKNNIAEFFSCFLKSKDPLSEHEIEELKKKVEHYEEELKDKF